MADPQSRTRILLDRDLDDNPSCVHGPMLRFSRENGRSSEFYGCSACRNRRECESSAGLGQGSDQDRRENALAVHRTTFDRLSENPVLYCHSCNTLGLKHEDHKGHSIKAITRNDLQYPTQILTPNDHDKTGAQYFFTESTVDTILNILKDLKCNKTICLGTPRLHETVRKSSDFKSILLDFDNRLMNFYGPEELLLYNMFNHYFFCGDYSRKVFSNFLKNDLNRDRICLLVDPPFGCRTEALSYTLKRIQLEYMTLNRAILPIIWVFPYFMERYVIKSMPEMTMLDYKVNYTNHSSYNESGRFGSPVRLFTNVDPKLVRFQQGFKFCSKCQMSTRLENKHCDKCRSCSSKNGAIYRHCMNCATCVKPYYVHCFTCNRCAQQDGHDCQEYQKNAFCWTCGEKGHVEKFCTRLKKPLPLKVKSPKSSTRICTICRRPNHNEKSCRKRNNKLADE